jgi:hypothetical protein
MKATSKHSRQLATHLTRTRIGESHRRVLRNPLEGHKWNLTQASLRQYEDLDPDGGRRLAITKGDDSNNGRVVRIVEWVKRRGVFMDVGSTWEERMGYRPCGNDNVL